MKQSVVLKRLAAILLLLCLVPVSAFSAAKQDDRIRVLLTRFSSLSELSVNISGSYSCGDMYFQRGMTVNLAPGAAKDQLILIYEGLALVHKGALTFTRHQADGENGLRFQGSMSLYHGDLTVRNQNGQLRLILSVPLEEYLLGVLPWEMSSAFPLEALKAQAVAARTYALTRRNSAQDYDMTDNTNDQVYAGVPDNADIIRRAVAETAGICVYYQDQLATCYYTASNGGRTETAERVWGKSSSPTGHTVAKADPYDLDNDESVVRQAEIPKDLTEDDLPALQALLAEKAAPVLKQLGYSDAPEDIRIREITDITANEKDHVAESLTFSLRVAGVRTTDWDEEETSFLTGDVLDIPVQPAASTAEKQFYSLSNPISVTVPIFPELEAALELSINRTPNEVWTVRSLKNSFVIEARRFGHGVGLSQRGAQRMAAAFGWNYKQILHFYYSGVTLKQTGLTAFTPAPKVDFDYDATPGPRPTPTPRPTLMPVSLKPGSKETLVVVDGVAEDSSLNLRAAPDTASDIITRLYYGQQLAVIEAADGWLHVRTDVLEGYVMEKFVSSIE